ncbi:MAG: kinase/pyrophosphorylase [Calditrichaeota bacterium]|nr:MAG: kinase/pyrophosphorylase [Calditrichota bacterium]
MSEEIVKNKDKVYKIYLISDSTGMTVDNLLKSVLTQFKDQKTEISYLNKIRTDAQIEHILEQAEIDKPFLIYTLVNKDHRAKLFEFSDRNSLYSVDVLGPILKKMAAMFEVKPEYLPGLFHSLSEEYFNRIESVEFAVKNDDGKNPNTLRDADIILAGVSRTSKTPLSIYLAGLGYKAANVPLVLGIDPPEELFKVNQRKIFGLIISPDKLKALRQERMKRLNQTDFTDYADEFHIYDELEYSREIFKKNQKWIVIDVSNKSVEETASEILRYVRRIKPNSRS